MTAATRARILVVDDNAMVRDVIGLMLAAEYELDVVSDVPAALELLSRNADAYDLLLTDVSIAGGDGRGLAATAKIIRPELPILYMSGTPEIDTHELEAGETFLPKPFTKEQLAAAIRAARDQA
jgi:CheY-like chemotaxis protein